MQKAIYFTETEEMKKILELTRLCDAYGRMISQAVYLAVVVSFLINALALLRSAEVIVYAGS